MNVFLLEAVSANTRRNRAQQIIDYAFALRCVCVVLFVAITPVLHDLIISNAYALLMMACKLVILLEATSIWHALCLIAIIGSLLVGCVGDDMRETSIARQLQAMTALWGGLAFPSLMGQPNA